MSPLGDAFGSLQPTTQSDASTEATEDNTMASQLIQLPAELILIVASMLPTSSAACLALSSRRISKILGPGHWRSLQIGAPGILRAFLTSLGRDLPQYFTWVSIPWSQRDGYLDRLVDDLHRDICKHTNSGLLGAHLTAKLVKSRLAQLEAQEEIRPQTLQCPECWMEHELDIADLGTRGFAILITKWVNLGSGLDFRDPKWQSHVTARANLNGGHPRQTGDIKKNFEAQTEIPMRDLTADNKLKLSSGRYERLLERLMHPDSHGGAVAPGGGRKQR
ncbi:hypothetical protein EYC84_007808 [Monilinia fructicola]|uniref:F-box domain-containing protein n=1 Tax=Monilinia fructicola TaxID=38448 RepID=A0A5M9JP99_MONFR|nr:hypothetical protein EYC84_007808 [Monilinia fructicola]